MFTFHRLSHPVLNMANSRRRVYTILFMTGILCILVMFETDTTDRQWWTSFTEGSSQLWHRFQLEGVRPCACNRCITDDDDPWFTERFNSSSKPFLTKDNALSERDFSWWKVNISNKAMLDTNNDKQVNPDSKHSQNQIYQYSLAQFSTQLLVQPIISYPLLFTSELAIWQ